MKKETAVITGAAGDIGIEIVKKLIKKDIRVIAIDIELNRLKNLTDYNSIYTYQVDLQDISTVIEVFQDISNKFEDINYLVNSAGVVQTKKMAKITKEDWDFLMSINLRAAFFCMQQAYMIMKNNNGGKIVNLSSVAGQTGGFKVSPTYSASKAGIIALTKAFAKRSGRNNILVNAVAPGTIKSKMSDNFDTENIEQNSPVGRLGLPEEVAEVVLFLLSSKSDYINGATIDVNGGVYLR